MKRKWILLPTTLTGAIASTIVVSSCGEESNETKLSNIVKTLNIDVSDSFKDSDPSAETIAISDLKIFQNDKQLNTDQIKALDLSIVNPKIKIPANNDTKSAEVEVTFQLISAPKTELKKVYTVNYNKTVNQYRAANIKKSVRIDLADYKLLELELTSQDLVNEFPDLATATKINNIIVINDATSSADKIVRADVFFGESNIVKITFSFYLTPQAKFNQYLDLQSIVFNIDESIKSDQNFNNSITKDKIHITKDGNDFIFPDNIAMHDTFSINVPTGDQVLGTVNIAFDYYLDNEHSNSAIVNFYYEFNYNKSPNQVRFDKLLDSYKKDVVQLQSEPISAAQLQSDFVDLSDSSITNIKNIAASSTSVKSTWSADVTFGTKITPKSIIFTYEITDQGFLNSFIDNTIFDVNSQIKGNNNFNINALPNGLADLLATDKNSHQLIDLSAQGITLFSSKIIQPQNDDKTANVEIVLEYKGFKAQATFTFDYTKSPNDTKTEALLSVYDINVSSAPSLLTSAQIKIDVPALVNATVIDNIQQVGSATATLVEYQADVAFGNAVSKRITFKYHILDNAEIIEAFKDVVFDVNADVKSATEFLQSLTINQISMTKNSQNFVLPNDINLLSATATIPSGDGVKSTVTLIFSKTGALNSWTTKFDFNYSKSLNQINTDKLLQNSPYQKRDVDAFLDPNEANFQAINSDLQAATITNIVLVAENSTPFKKVYHADVAFGQANPATIYFEYYLSAQAAFNITMDSYQFDVTADVKVVATADDFNEKTLTSNQLIITKNNNAVSLPLSVTINNIVASAVSDADSTLSTLTMVCYYQYDGKSHTFNLTGSFDYNRSLNQIYTDALANSYLKSNLYSLPTNEPNVTELTFFDQVALTGSKITNIHYVSEQSSLVKAIYRADVAFGLANPASIDFVYQLSAQSAFEALIANYTFDVDLDIKNSTNFGIQTLLGEDLTFFKNGVVVSDLPEKITIVDVKTSPVSGDDTSSMLTIAFQYDNQDVVNTLNPIPTFNYAKSPNQVAFEKLSKTQNYIKNVQQFQTEAMSAQILLQDFPDILTGATISNIKSVANESTQSQKVWAADIAFGSLSQNTKFTYLITDQVFLTNVINESTFDVINQIKTANNHSAVLLTNLEADLVVITTQTAQEFTLSSKNIAVKSASITKLPSGDSAAATVTLVLEYKTATKEVTFDFLYSKSPNQLKIYLLAAQFEKTVATLPTSMPSELELIAFDNTALAGATISDIIEVSSLTTETQKTYRASVTFGLADSRKINFVFNKQ